MWENVYENIIHNSETLEIMYIFNMREEVDRITTYYNIIQELKITF